MRLSSREVEVLQWMRMGKTNEEIAQILSVSALTVKNHAGSIYRKLSVPCRMCAVMEAIRLGIIEVEVESVVSRVVELEIKKEPEERIVAIDGVQIFADGGAMFGERHIQLGKTEARLLVFFFSHAGRMHTRSAILDAVWGWEVCVEERVVDANVRKLRKCLAGTKWRIDAVRGYGYRLVER